MESTLQLNIISTGKEKGTVALSRVLHIVLGMEFKTTLWQCDGHDFDVIVELSVESFSTQCRHGPLSVLFGLYTSQNSCTPSPTGEG